MQMKSRALAPFAFDLLPLGSVQPRGWIRDQLKLCAEGLGGNLYNFHRFVKDSSWLGGDVEYSPLRESAPYWYNYIVPLAYILDDNELKKQANQFLDRILKNQHADGWIGPEHTKHGRGIWARCLVLMGMVNHAVADPAQYNRIVEAMLSFTKLANSMLKDNFQGLIPHPGDEFDEFCITRAHELSTSLQWLYDQVENRQDKILIWDTMDLAWEASRVGDRDWSKFFTEEQFPKKPAAPGSTLMKHVVNVSEALRYMPQLYRMTHDPELVAHTRQSVDMVFKYHGTTFGAISGDEFLAGLHPRRGAELCGTAELIFSLSYMYRLFGDNSYADRAELATFNGLPAGMTEDWWAHNYLTQSNEVWARNLENWPFYNCGGRALVYGLEVNYPCCLVNHSQALPKFAMNAFVASPDLRFIAHQFLVPAEAKIPVTGRRPIYIISETHYPFDEKLSYEVETDQAFEFYIRVPEWATKGTTINRASGNEETKEETIEVDANNLYKIAIAPGKTAFTITLNAEIRVVPRPNNAVAIYRGALLYAMEIPHKAKVGPPTHFAERKPLPDAEYSPKLCDVEYTPTADWRVAIDPSQMHFHRSEVKGNLPNPVFASGAPPVSINVAGTKISNWELEGDCAGLPPANPAATGKPFGVKLVPFASAKLHISEFPVVDLSKDKVNLQSRRPSHGHCVLM
ncbi:hypothetical protein UA08_00565 [Talaromyces atroroseus]|uniref:Uncharacterized protein n=1 Tax=Talaromyces atroroseus TaxID=1441469 RepID=A0A225AYB0_TALAT|nr:hypothetical protein UA08_00565 [Talaromyces atroroseus]OKL64613.1 hypothetical protein UA08_00565 [Talaromyces atroroseus]